MKTSGYYDWMHGTQTCSHCGWSGTGKQTRIRESFRDGAERECPRCGEEYFGFVAYPYLDETINDPRADPIDRDIALIIKKRATVKDQE
jgi:hypothetical protein